MYTHSQRWLVPLSPPPLSLSFFVFAEYIRTRKTHSRQNISGKVEDGHLPPLNEDAPVAALHLRSLLRLFSFFHSDVKDAKSLLLCKRPNPRSRGLKTRETFYSRILSRGAFPEEFSDRLSTTIARAKSTNRFFHVAIFSI